MPSLLGVLDWTRVRSHYDDRVATHKKLQRLYQRGQLVDFVDLILGISDPTGNYSANDHHLGPKILTNRNADNQIWQLATEFMTATGFEVPELVKLANINNLAISVGSEASCMLSPEECWVTNTRTVYTHLVFHHGGNTRAISMANEALTLFRQHDRDSEMDYGRWMAPFHLEILQTSDQILSEGDACAEAAGVTPGTVRYLWLDAIASAFYDRYGRVNFRKRAA